MKSRVLAAFQWFGILTAAAGCGSAGQPVDHDLIVEERENLYVLTPTLWPVNPTFGYPTAPICWEQTGFDTEKSWMRDTIVEGWQLESQLRFIGFGNCSASSNDIRVEWRTDVSGGWADFLGTDVAGVEGGVTLGTSSTALCRPGWTREECVRGVSVHEIGHALGFAHEHNRDDTPPSCEPCTSSGACPSGERCVDGHCEQGSDGNLAIGEWDGSSVMNYCKPEHNAKGRLSGGDIHGLVEVYGHPTPVVASGWGGDTMAAFIRGPSNALYSATSTNGTTWSAFSSRGGEITSAPSVASWGPDRLDVFARGTDGKVWTKYWTPSGWSGWSNLGGPIVGKPKVIARANNRLEVLVRGTDDALWVRRWNGSTWGTSWTSLGGDFVGEPAVASWGSDRIDVFVRGRDNNLRHIALSGAAWGGWTNLGGGDLTSSPSAVSWGPNRVDVVVTRASNILWHRSYNGTSWSSWANLGNGIILNNPRITARPGNVLDVFGRGSDNAIWQITWNGSAWTSWASHGLASGPFKGSPEVQSRDGRIHVFAQASDDAVWRRTWTTNWSAWTKLGGGTVE